MTAFEKTVLFSFVSKNILKGGAGGSDSRSVSVWKPATPVVLQQKTRHYRIKRCFIMGKDENTGFSL